MCITSHSPLLRSMVYHRMMTAAFPLNFAITVVEYPLLYIEYYMGYVGHKKQNVAFSLWPQATFWFQYPT